MKQLIIDRSKWRTGGRPYSDKLGPTQLLNREGYMCCLGFYCIQLGNKKEEEILGVTAPYGVEDTTGLEFLVNRTLDINSKFSCEAIEQNDNDLILDKEREERIKELFKRIDVEVTFINEHPNKSE